MLRTLSNESKTDWKSHLNQVVHAYNCTKHDTTGYSPFYLLFGRHPRLPLDILFRPSSEKHGEEDHAKYVKGWTERMQEAYRIASENATHSVKKGKRQHDSGFVSTALVEGDRVLVRNLREKGGPGKLRSFWENDVYVVVRKIREDASFYEVRQEDGKGNIRRLHRNILLQCNSLPLKEDHSVSVKPGRKRRQGNFRKAKSRNYAPTHIEDWDCDLVVERVLDPLAEPFMSACPDSHAPDSVEGETCSENDDTNSCVTVSNGTNGSKESDVTEDRDESDVEDHEMSMSGGVKHSCSSNLMKSSLVYMFCYLKFGGQFLNVKG